MESARQAFQLDVPEAQQTTQPSLAPRSPHVSPVYGPGKLPAARESVAQPTMNTASSDSTPSAAQRAVSSFKAASVSDRELLVNAAAHLETHDRSRAADLLDQYLQRNPAALIVRLQLGELYFKMEQLDLARLHVQQALTQAEEQGDLPLRYLLHGHSRLMDIAAATGELFEEELHRGLGLLLLAEKRMQETQPKEVPAEELLGKALKAFQRGVQLRPADARPQLYLVSVWLNLRQCSSAQLALARAEALSFMTMLSPAERTRLARYSLELSSMLPD